MADVKAISTYKTYLHYKSEGSYTKLIDIKDFPDLGGEPEMLETTTLSDKMQTYIPGIQSLDALSFTCNYTKEDYARLNDITGEQDFAVLLGEGGEHGIFKFSGQLSVYVSGGGVNEVVNMTVSIAPSTVIEPVESLTA